MMMKMTNQKVLMTRKKNAKRRKRSLKN